MDGDRFSSKIEVALIKSTRSCSILGVPDLKVGLCHLRSLRSVDKLRPAAQDNVFAEGTLPKCSLHGVRRDFNAVGTMRDIEELTVAL
jgi:hypothetical protein